MHAAGGSLVVSLCNTTVDVWFVCLALVPVRRPCRFLIAFHARFLGSPSLKFVETSWACFWTGFGEAYKCMLHLPLQPVVLCSVLVELCTAFRCLCGAVRLIQGHNILSAHRHIYHSCACHTPWLAVCIGFVWVHADSFLQSVASPFHSFVTTTLLNVNVNVNNVLAISI